MGDTMSKIPIIAAGTTAVDATGPGGAADSIDVRTANELLLVHDGPDDCVYYLNEKGAFVAGGGEDGVTGKFCFMLESGENVVETHDILENFFLICDTGETASVRYKASKTGAN